MTLRLKLTAALVTLTAVAALAEPSLWAVAIAGLGLTGAMLRRRRQLQPVRIRA